MVDGVSNRSRRATLPVPRTKKQLMSWTSTVHGRYGSSSWSRWITLPVPRTRRTSGRTFVEFCIRMIRPGFRIRMIRVLFRRRRPCRSPRQRQCQPQLRRPPRRPNLGGGRENKLIRRTAAPPPVGRVTSIVTPRIYLIVAASVMEFSRATKVVPTIALVLSRRPCRFRRRQPCRSPRQRQCQP